MRKYDVTVNNKTYSVSVKSFSPEAAVLDINGRNYVVKLDASIQLAPGSNNGQQSPVAPAAPPQPVPQPVPTQPVTASSPPVPAQQPAAGDEAVVAPIPGSILEIPVKNGDEVKAGQLLLKMEAMKMENEINSTVDGKVKSISVVVGDAVNQGQTMLIIEKSA